MEAVQRLDFFMMAGKSLAGLVLGVRAHMLKSGIPLIYVLQDWRLPYLF